MHDRFGSTVLVLALAISAVACIDGAPDSGADAGEQRRILNQGYSMLYTDASRLDLAGLVLYVKIESQEFHEVVSEISGYGEELGRELERLARDYPALRIDLDPLPEMEKRKRFAVGRDRAIRFAPLSGRSRLEYERIMLSSIANALNHESHLCQVMAAEEPEPGLKKFLLASEKRFRDLSDLALNLLTREHFKSETSPPARP